MAPIVTTGVLIVEKTFSRVILVLGAMLIFQYRSTGDPQFVRVILAPKSCNFHRIEKRSHARSFHQYLHSRIMHVILAQRAMQIFSVQKKKTCNRFHVEEKIVISAKDPQYSAVGFSVIFALLGEQSRVPEFRPSQTLWAASQAVDGGRHIRSLFRSFTHHLSASCPSFGLGFSGTCCPPFVIRKAYTIEGSSTQRRESSAIRRLYCSTRCARRCTSFASVFGASMLLARGGLLGRGRASSPLSAAAVQLPALPRGRE